MGSSREGGRGEGKPSPLHLDLNYVRPMVDGFWAPTWGRLGSKLGPSWVQVGSKLASKWTLEGSQGRHGWGPGLQDQFLIDFGSQHGAKLGPSWPHNRIHTGMFFRSSFWIQFCSLLGSILDTFWGPKWSRKVNLRQEVSKLQNLILA